MKASQVGNNNKNSRLLDHFGSIFNWNLYLKAKYEGLFPEDFPTSKEMKDVRFEVIQAKRERSPELSSILARKSALEKRIKSVAREWQR